MKNTIPITVVIITLNEAAHIGACISSARALTNDIVVVDSGSIDGTEQRAALGGARVIHNNWGGYGAARNYGAAAARHDWILALDADERIPDSTVELLKMVHLEKGTVYRFRRHNHINSTRIRFGAYGFDRIARLYNKLDAAWNNFPVHERLEGRFVMQQLPAHIDHFGISNLDEYRVKKNRYAALSSLKYHGSPRKFNWIRQVLAPVFDAAKSYIFQLGFLDGKAGWFLAATTYRYTFLKYKWGAQRPSRKESSLPEISCVSPAMQSASAAS